MRREKLSITACRYSRVPSSNRMTVTSMCQYSLGLVANSLLGRRGMDTSARPEPATFSNESTPGCRRREEHPDVLGVERETADRHVAIAAAGRKVVHGADFLGRELRRRRSRAVLRSSSWQARSRRFQAWYREGER